MKEEEIRNLLKALLEGEKTQWIEEGAWIRFRSRKDGMLWETACTPCTDGMLFFARFPFRCRDPAKALGVCGEVNRRLVTGALFLSEEGCPVYRCRAVLDDVYLARERIEAALRYSAQVLAHCWGRFSGS